MTNHDWAANASQCAIARAHQHPWGSERYQREFEAFQDLAICDWRWTNHPPHLGGRVN